MTGAHVNHLVKLLTYVIKRNEVVTDETVTLFHCKQEEEEALQSFIARLDDNIRCSESCYATALVFIDRITEMSSDLTLNYWTVQRLFTTSLLIANQFLDDTAERTLQFARVAGFHPLTMAAMKTDFLFRIQFRLMVSDEDVIGYSDKLQGRFSSAEFSRLQLWSGKSPQKAAKKEITPIQRAQSPASQCRTSARSEGAITNTTTATTPATKASSHRKSYSTMFNRSQSRGAEKSDKPLKRSQTDGESLHAVVWDMTKPVVKPSKRESFANELKNFGLHSLVL